MAKRMTGESYALLILNALMTHSNPLTTVQLCDICGCERKTVYKTMELLEISGFGIEINRSNGMKAPNTYKLNGVYGV